MKTLIELYDERPIENVLASEVFKPERTVFLCPADIAQDKTVKEKLAEYFKHRGLNTELIFLETSIYNSDKIEKQLLSITEKYPDCVLDITGGTDAALFAGGKLCAQFGTPTFTYSRKRNCFFSIHNADFADELPCEISHTIEDCFLMAGGALRDGRVDNGILKNYMSDIEPFFKLYMRNRRDWTRTVNYIQRASQAEKGVTAPLNVSAPYIVKGERGTRIEAPEDVLYELEKIDLIRNVSISRERVEFTFRDRQIRAWLRDIGSVLELYIYKCCIDTGLFNDVRTSAVVDWEGAFRQDDVTNEIDVMAMRGITPLFISCKTCEISTEALNELAILRDRFGGNTAKAAIVTTKRCQNITRHRASELHIEVIDLDDINDGKVKEHIASMIK